MFKSWEATTRFELVIRVLQTRALPLGYVALLWALSEIEQYATIELSAIHAWHLVRTNVVKFELSSQVLLWALRW